VQPTPVPRRRRRWVRVVTWTGIAVGVLVAVVVAVGAWLYAGADISNAGELSFRNPLRIPELDRGERGADGVVRFDLEVQAGETSILPGGPTATWGVNGAHLGPTLRASRGDDVEIALTNGVGETTSMHWHGMHLPAIMDGGPHQPVEPGETWRPSWTVDQPAATLWYHPHPHGETAEHVYRGVAGMFILDDPGAAALGLPDDYGVDDIPVIIQDRSFDSATSSTTPAASSPTSGCSATRSSSTAPRSQRRRDDGARSAAAAQRQQCPQLRPRPGRRAHVPGHRHRRRAARRTRRRRPRVVEPR
jgi:FtsP/CotA-like multicopper oxidase with cupredoxin domain